MTMHNAYACLTHTQLRETMMMLAGAQAPADAAVALLPMLRWGPIDPAGHREGKSKS